MRITPGSIPETIKGKDIALGAYLCSNPDPQGKPPLQPDNMDYVGGWIASAARLGLNVVILHDSLSNTFTRKLRLLHERTKRGGTLHCIKVAPGDYSPNDERFLIVRDMLRISSPRAVCLVDLPDARFNRSPFPLLRHSALPQPTYGIGIRKIYPFDSLTLQGWQHPVRVLFGAEEEPIENNPWMHRQFQRILGHIPPELESGPVYNCGAICASRDDLLNLLETVSKKFEVIGKKQKLMDMSVFNLLLHTSYRFIAGKTAYFTSPFKDYHTAGPWAILHK